jgi:magnesium chelatase family protein
MISHCASAALRGVEAVLVRVEVDLAPGLPYFHIVGLAGHAARESCERVKSALDNAGYDVLGTRRATATLAPFEIPKESTGHDLPLALAVLEAAGVIPRGATKGGIYAGELAPSGALRPIQGAMPIAELARARGMGAVLPSWNSDEVSLFGDDVRIADSLAEVVACLRGERELPAPTPRGALVTDTPAPLDVLDIKGQERAKHALAIPADRGRPRSHR